MTPELAVGKEECLEHCKGTIMDIDHLRWSGIDFGEFRNIWQIFSICSWLLFLNFGDNILNLPLEQLSEDSDYYHNNAYIEYPEAIAGHNKLSYERGKVAVQLSGGGGGGGGCKSEH